MSMTLSDGKYVHDQNMLTQKLLSEGWTKENHPDYVQGYNDFYGGFTYTCAHKCNMIFKSPCGLFVKFHSVIEGMSFMGTDWSVENDCVVIHCPYFQRKNICSLNDRRLEEHVTKLGNKRGFVDCAVHATDEPYDYDKSAEKLFDEQQKLKSDKIKEFTEKKKGHVCPFNIDYDYQEMKARQRYNVNDCIMLRCDFCQLRQKEMTSKKCHVVYDLELKYTVLGEGLIPDEEKTTVTKNLKFTEHPIYKNLAEASINAIRQEIQDRESRNRGSLRVMGKQFVKVNKVTVKNVRAEAKLKHDIYEDLELIKSGIEVSYADITLKQAKAQKSERLAAAKQKRLDKIKQTYIENGYDGMGDYIYQFDKLMDKGTWDWAQLEELREQYLEEQERKKQEESEQLSFFDEE